MCQYTSPKAYPSSFFNPLFFAHLRLPSGIIPMCLGIRNMMPSSFLYFPIIVDNFRLYYTFSKLLSLYFTPFLPKKSFTKRRKMAKWVSFVANLCHSFHFAQFRFVMW